MSTIFEKISTKLTIFKGKIPENVNKNNGIPCIIHNTSNLNNSL